MLDLPPILAAIREQLHHEPRWLALAGWLADEGRDDEAAAVRVHWRTLAENVAGGVSVDETVAEVTRHAKLLGEVARRIEERRYEPGE
jgi:hypothetical protein